MHIGCDLPGERLHRIGQLHHLHTKAELSPWDAGADVLAGIDRHDIVVTRQVMHVADVAMLQAWN
jgi:hypothetical protein